MATFLVGKGKIMAAQYRLGHGHVGTTLRHYTHSVALEDLDIADDIDTMLNAPAVRRTIRDGSPVVGRPLASAK